MSLTTKEQIAVDNHYDLQQLLNRAGYNINGDTQIFCPFHDDVQKKSASYYENTDTIYCFAERETYGAYDFLKQRGKSEQEIVEGVDLSNVQKKKNRQYKEEKLDKEWLDKLRLEYIEQQDIDKIAPKIVKEVC